MILRLAAVGSAAIGLVLLGLYLAEVGKAPWSSPAQRHLRRMKDRAAAPAAYASFGFDSMTALPRRGAYPSYAALEARGVSLEGYVQRMQRAPDGDYHLDFAPTLDPEGHLVPYLSAEITPQWQRGSTTWRYARLAETFRPYQGDRTRWDRPPVRTRISGWLMNDYPFEGIKEMFGFPPHLTQWEIHPVTRIETWDDSLVRMVELPR